MRYDLAIVGAGASGLALAHELLASPLRDRSIVIVERDATDDDQRTFSYWTERATPFDDLVHRRWDRLRFASPWLDRTLALAPFRYETVRGIHLLEHLRTELAKAPRAEWKTGVVRGAIEDAGDHARFELEGRTIEARWVFDSRFRHADLQVDPRRHHLMHQVFEGWIVETDHDAFDVAVPTMFDFRDHDMRFFYVLPYDARRALVEHVRMRPEPAERALRSYVEDVLGLPSGSYRVRAREGGTSALTDAPFERRLGARVMAIGRRGGLLKPTTGYAFTRILDDSRAIVRSLETHGHPFDVPPRRRLYAWLDAVMLELMQTRGDRMARLFTEMFRRNPAPRLLRFLDERASWRELAMLVGSMPIGLPLMAAMRLTMRRL
ncbi:lycopene cyclase family protein [Sandaracinus amylolyticus]|uniref:lycopene cyclase family protein n=1 Tax=Sandaracinus amylolyticus TaxID=927083 RepID=UPI001F3DB642|nr:lycopene cyclase family protein [Sandaracinus amylolyticus]UJR85199.1 Hypothetical protein I5071_72790 [Sandaracinus amylolyticus]